jgi:hypothetical protein
MQPVGENSGVDFECRKSGHIEIYMNKNSVISTRYKS